MRAISGPKRKNNFYSERCYYDIIIENHDSAKQWGLEKIKGDNEKW